MMPALTVFIIHLRLLLFVAVAVFHIHCMHVVFGC